jgi:hypothetical protein
MQDFGTLMGGFTQDDGMESTFMIEAVFGL